MPKFVELILAGSAGGVGFSVVTALFYQVITKSKFGYKYELAAKELADKGEHQAAAILRLTRIVAFSASFVLGFLFLIFISLFVFDIN